MILKITNIETEEILAEKTLTEEDDVQTEIGLWELQISIYAVDGITAKLDVIRDEEIMDE